MKKNFFIIQSKEELNFFLSKKEFKKYTPIIWYPEITNFKEKRFVYISDIEKLKTKPVDIFLMKKFYKLLKNIDHQILKSLDDIPKLNYFFYAGHGFKNLIEVYLNEVNRIKILLKKSKKIGFFKKNTQSQFNFVNLIIENFNLIDSKIFETHNFSRGNTKYFFEENYNNLITFLDEKNFNLKNFFLINNFFIKELLNLRNKKTRILTHTFDKHDDNFFSSKNFQNIEFIKYESIFFRYKKIKLDRNKKKNLFNKLLKYKKINFDFLNNKKIDHKKILLKLILQNIEKVLNIVIYNHNKALYINKKYNFKSIIHKYETISAITIADSLKNREKKSFFLSHGGTVGIFNDWPPITNYFVPYHKNITYLTFSKNIKDRIININKKLNKKLNIEFTPNYRHIDFLTNTSFPKKISKIAYFFSPTYGIYESKINFHHDINIDYFRKNLFKHFSELKNIKINCKLYNLKSIPKSFLKELKKNKNVKILPDKTQLSKIFNNNDLIITEVNSTTLVEAQYSNKFILCIVKSFPKIQRHAKKKLERRVTLTYGEKDFYKKLSGFISKKFVTNSDKNFLSNRDFLKSYYSHRNLKKKIIVKKFKRLLN